MITHPQLSKVMRILRPDANRQWPVFDCICQQDADGPPFLAKNYEANPVTQEEVDSVTPEQIATI